MNIYLLSQDSNTLYEIYTQCVVLAEFEEEAKLVHPANSEFDEFRNEYYYNYQYVSKYDRFIDLKEWTEEDIETVILKDKWYDSQEDALNSWFRYTSWCKSPKDVTVKYIGEFKGNLDDYPTRIICTSFNAG